MDDQYNTLLTSMSTLCEQMAAMVEDKKKMIVDINELKRDTAAMKLQLEAIQYQKEEEKNEFIKHEEIKKEEEQHTDWFPDLQWSEIPPEIAWASMDESLDFVSGVFVH